MTEFDPLRPVLREWEAPEPPLGMDARVRAAYRTARPASSWRRIWSVRVSVPAPVLAALLLVIAALLLQFRSAPPAPRPALRLDSTLVALPGGQGYVTRLDATGFQPLPDGAARVVRSEGIIQ